jgi:hypothetical protein
MHFTRRGLLFLLLAFLTAGFLQAKESPKEILERLPQEIAGIRKGEIHDYGDARLGFSVAYDAPGLVITAYIYDLGQSTIADGLDDPIVKDAFAGAKREIQVAADRGAYSDVKVLGDGRGTFHGRELTLSAKYELTRQQGRDAGLRVFSEIHIFGARNQIIKLRISGDLSKHETTGPLAEKFVEEFVKAVQLLPPAKL